MHILLWGFLTVPKGPQYLCRVPLTKGYYEYEDSFVRGFLSGHGFRVSIIFDLGKHPPYSSFYINYYYESGQGFGFRV